ncbi:MAG: multifunctional CCA addition/repair protein [Methylococcales bacterium]|nr:multifunctional CCA addition/repair protein [Methylococcales bacterium]
MDIYLVGGAVRDGLLHRPVKERDWVVVGATPGQMHTLGYQAVGKDFPVFLHPETREEYALARTERKSGRGYTGFQIHAAPDVTLEQDLGRRDLTINAIAKGEDGRLIDPFGGLQDLHDRMLRHVSPAFIEDPVRVLRIARFAARYAPLGFRIAPETEALLRGMVDDGEVDHLVAERVWQETVKALSEARPSVFIETLRQCGALASIMPELDALFGVPQPASYHPEIDTGVHTLMVLDQAAQLSDDIAVRFAALVHDLGKAVTPKANWPHHYAHEQLGLPILTRFCKRLRVPNKHQQLARVVMKHHTLCHRAFELRPGTLHKLLSELGAYKSPNTLDAFVIACQADSQGRTGFADRPYPQAEYLRGAAQQAASISSQPFMAQGHTGKALGEAIAAARIKALAAYKQRCAPA